MQIKTIKTIIRIRIISNNFLFFKKMKYIKIGNNKNLKKINESWKELTLLIAKKLIIKRLVQNSNEILTKFIFSKSLYSFWYIKYIKPKIALDEIIISGIAGPVIRNKGIKISK